MREVDESWSTAALIEAAFTELHDHRPYTACPAIVALHARGNREVLEAALTLYRSLDSRWRALAASILGELGHPDRTFPEACCKALVQLLHDEAQEVQISAIYALGHLGSRDSDPDLLAFADHPDAQMRKGVGFALNGTTLPAALPILLRLMNDADVEARDWATTTLGEATCFDGPEVRQALLERAATDGDDMIRGEALCGLARRGDRRATALLMKEFDAADEPYHFLEAAKLMLGFDELENVPPETLLEALRDRRH